MPTFPPDSQSPRSRWGKSFYRQAATFSLAAPFTAIGFNIFFSATTAGIDPASRASVRFFISLLLCLLMLSGLIAGIVALFGIKKYGPKGIRLKAIFGIIIPILLVALAVPAFYKVRELSQQAYAKQYRFTFFPPAGFTDFPPGKTKPGIVHSLAHDDGAGNRILILVENLDGTFPPGQRLNSTLFASHPELHSTLSDVVWRGITMDLVRQQMDDPTGVQLVSYWMQFPTYPNATQLTVLGTLGQEPAIKQTILEILKASQANP